MPRICSGLQLPLRQHLFLYLHLFHFRQLRQFPGRLISSGLLLLPVGHPISSVVLPLLVEVEEPPSSLVHRRPLLLLFLRLSLRLRQLLNLNRWLRLS